MALGVNGVAQGALPVATGAGEIPRSTGAGTNYASVSQGDVLADAIGDVGAANVRTALDVYSAAEVDAAVAGGAGGGAVVTQRPFNATHWTVVPAVTPSEGVATLEAGDIGRVSITSTANVVGLNGPRLERAWPETTRPSEPVRVRVTVQAKVGTGTAFGQFYIRSGGVTWVIGTRTNNEQTFTYNWAGDIVNVASFAVWDGTLTFDIYVAGGNIHFTAEISGVRTYLRSAPIAQNFYPSHWGVAIGGDGAVTASVDYIDAVEEVG